MLKVIARLRELLSIKHKIKESKEQLRRLVEQKESIAKLHVQMMQELQTSVQLWYERNQETMEYAEFYKYLRNDPPLELAVRKKNPTPGDGRSPYIYIDGFNLDREVEKAIQTKNQEMAAVEGWIDEFHALSHSFLEPL
jgi:hypothetical protein